MQPFNNRLSLFKILLILFAAWAVIFLYAQPFLKEQRALSGQISQKKKLLYRFTQLIANRDSLQETYARIFLGLKKENNTGASVSAFRELETIAKNSAVKIIDMRQSSQAQGEASAALIEMKAKAREEDYLNFIQGLKNSKFLFSVDRFIIRSPPGSSLLEAEFLISFRHPS